MSLPPTQNFERLRELLLIEDIARLERIEKQLKMLDAQILDSDRLLEQLDPLLVDLIGDKIVEGRERFAEALYPIIGPAIKRQIEESKEEVIDALYPVIGATIRRSMSEAIRKLTKTLNQKIDAALSTRRFTKIFNAWFGKPVKEQVLQEALPFSVEEVFLLQRDSGLLLAHAAKKQRKDENTKELLGGLLAAIQNFANDMFDNDDEDQLQQLIYHKSDVTLEMGRHAYLAAATKGAIPPTFQSRLGRCERKIHSLLHQEFRKYKGDSSVFKQITPRLNRLLQDEFFRKVTPSPPTSTVSQGFKLATVSAIVIFLLYLGVSQLYNVFSKQDAATQIEQYARNVPELSDARVFAKVNNDALELAGEVADSSDRRLLLTFAKEELGVDSVNSRYLNVSATKMERDEILQLLANSSAAIDFSRFRYHISGTTLTVFGEVNSEREQSWAGETLARSLPFKIIVNNISLNSADAVLTDSVKIYFDAFSSRVPEGEKAKLQKLTDALRDATIRRISVVGYSDNVGAAANNVAMSQKRAESVQQELIVLGISPDILTTQGLGAANPAADSQTEAGRALNRRVELTIEYHEK